jgi:hypothetical protein
MAAKTWQFTQWGRPMLLQQTPAESWLSQHQLTITTIVAVLALIQPLLSYTYRQVFRRGSARLYESGLLGVYYGTQGPSLEVLGTVRATHEDQFIRSIRATVIKERDSSRHEFQWRYSRVPSFGPEGPSTSFAFATSFMVTPAQTQYVDLILHDEDLEKRLQPLGEEIKEMWEEFVTNPDPAAHPEGTIKTFLSTGRVREIQAQIKRMCYWEEGSYKLRLDITTDDPAKTFSRHCTFELTPSQAKAQRENSQVMLRGWLQLPFSQAMNVTSQTKYTCTG